MITSLKLIIAATTFSVVAGAAQAASMGGAGTLPCNKLSVVIQKNLSDAQLAVVEWGLGFMTALNTTQSTAHQIDGDAISEQIWTAVSGYCRSNPDKVPAIAVIGLWKTLPKE